MVAIFNDWLALIFLTGLPEENIVLVATGQVQILNIAPFLPPRPAQQAYNSYLCTYGLYSTVRNAFDAGSIHYEGKWEGARPWKSRLFGPCGMASSG